MSTIEDRLRDALAERAKHSPTDPDAWERTRNRSLAGRRRLGWRGFRAGRVLIPTGAAAAVVAIVVGVTATLSHVTGWPANPAPAAAKPGPAASRGAQNPTRGPLGINDYPPVSALLTFRLTAPGTGRTAVAYSWLAYTSPYVWSDQLPGLKSCISVRYPVSALGDCTPLPQLGAGDLVRVTDSTYLGPSIGPLVLQGLAVNQVTSVTAVLPDGQVIPGVVKTGRGFSDKAWAVVAPADEATYKPVSGIRLVFRDASGAEVATLSTAVPGGSFRVAQPSSGGIAAFAPPKSRSGDHSVTAYLIDGYVGFFYPEPPLIAAVWMAPQPAADSPVLAGLTRQFGQVSGTDLGLVIEAFGYAHADVTRVVLRLDGGRAVSTSTFAAWPGSGLRLWAVPVWQGITVNELPVVTATGYNAAGQAVAHVKLGSGI
jgi:hypothetical protein